MENPIVFNDKIWLFFSPFYGCTHIFVGTRITWPFGRTMPVLCIGQLMPTSLSILFVQIENPSDLLFKEFLDVV